MVLRCFLPSFGMTMPGRGFQAGKYRYGFNGKEKDNSTGEGNLDFGARIHDARIGRWLSVDELEKKYPQVTPYGFCFNSPIRIVDADGRDIIVLSAPNAVGGLGHAAILIGNDKGWYFYSKNGTYGSVSGSGSSGPANKNPDKGVYFKSLTAFANNYRNFDKDGNVEYSSAFRITSSAEVDSKMKAAALKQVNSFYDVLGNVSGSCIDVCSDALSEGGFDNGKSFDQTSGSGYGVGKGWAVGQTAKSTIPNGRFSSIVKKNKGTDITSQITPSDETKAKYKKEANDKNDIERIENQGNPTLLDKIQGIWNKVKEGANETIKQIDNATPRPGV